MAEDMSSIFNKKAVDRLRSPDDMDRCIKVTNPSVWIVLAACVALLAGLLVWGVFGTVITNVSATGIVLNVSDTDTDDPVNADAPEEGRRVAMCFLPADVIANISVGDVADVGGQKMAVSWICSYPSAPDEWNDLLQSQYLTKALFNGEWRYCVWFDGDVSTFEEGLPVSVVITTERVPPISLIFRRWD